MAKKGENITKRKDGRWEARVIKGYNNDGKALYKYIYAKTYTEVRKKRNEYSVDCNITENYKNGKVIMSAILDDFLTFQKNRVKESTFTRYCDIVSLHIKPELGDIQVGRLTTKLIDAFINKKIESGRIDKKGGLSAKRVHDIISVLKLSLIFAQDKCGYNVPNIKYTLPKISTTKNKVLSKDDEAKLLIYITDNIDSMKSGVLISLCTGIRIGELCALKWSDIDFNSNLIFINKTLQRIPDMTNTAKTKINISSPKSAAGVRYVPIPNILKNYLMQIHENVKSDDSYVLTSTKKYIEPSNYYLKYQEWLKCCGIQKFSFHTLRHTFATRAIECGMDTKTLSEILGHSDVKITLSKYVHPSIEMKYCNMEKINKYICSRLFSRMQTGIADKFR